jgi:hypothetical protein
MGRLLHLLHVYIWGSSGCGSSWRFGILARCTCTCIINDQRSGTNIARVNAPFHLLAATQDASVSRWAPNLE